MFLFRCDASPNMGYGHLMRCRQLAYELYKRGRRVGIYGPSRELMTASDSSIFSNWKMAPPWESPRADALALLDFGQEHGAQAYILDDYRVDEVYQIILRDAGVKWLQFEGRLGQSIWADALYCANIAIAPKAFIPYLRNENCNLLAGLRYALLRDEFQEVTERPAVDVAKRVFLSFGGGSDRGGLEFVLRALLPRFPSITFCVMSGERNPNNGVLQRIGTDYALQVALHIGARNVADLMKACDFSIMAAGTTTLEAAALRLPMILIPIAKNQEAPAEAWSDLGAAINLGRLEYLSRTQIVATFEKMLQPVERTRQIKAMRALDLDGKGTTRVAEAMEKMLAY